MKTAQARASAMRVGFIGLGRMGNPMARNLIRAGFRLTVYDLRPEAVNALVALGAEGASSAKDLASKCEVCFTSLPTPGALEEATMGPSGFLGGVSPGSTLILTDTILPETARKIAEAALEKRVAVLDAPVSGGPQGAEAGTLAVMVGGERAVFERCRPLLEAVGRSVFYVGPSGSGCVVKLVNNLLSLANTAVLCEGMVVGAKAGVDPKTLWEVISKSTGRSYALEHKLPQKIAKGDFQPGFALELACKDLELIASLARRLAVPIPLAGATQLTFEWARARGLGGLDHTAVVRLLEELAGVEVRF